MWLIPPPESSKCAPAPERSASASPELFAALARSATSSEKHIRPSAWSRLWKQETWIRRLSTWATWGHSRRTAGQDWWTLSQPASPVRATASPAPVAASTTRDGSGPRLDDSYAFYDPATSFWRTSQGSLLSLMGEPSAGSSVTWTRSGIGMGGAVYRQPKLVPPTGAIVSGSSRGRRWPTPRYEDSQSVNQSLARRAAGRPPEHVESAARELIGRLWSTPSAGNFNDSETPQSWRARVERLKEKGVNGNGAGIPLAIQAKETVGKLWATPSASPWRSGEASDETYERNARPLNEQALRFQRGLPSPTTPKDGEPSSVATPSSLQLNPWFDEWLEYGLEMIGWTCVCPARALARVVAGSPRLATPSAPTRRQPRSGPSGAAVNLSCDAALTTGGTP